MASENSSHRQSITLNVKNLTYIPAVDYLEEAKNRAKSLALTLNISKYVSLPKTTEKRSSTPLYNVSFQVGTGKVTAVLSDQYAERRTLLQLLVGIRKTGSFTGDIALTGPGLKGLKYARNVAYVPHVSDHFPEPVCI